MRGAAAQFFLTALPVFPAITFAASCLSYLGVLDWWANELRLALAHFRLPGDAALAIVMGSVRKDGILFLNEIAARFRSCRFRQRSTWPGCCCRVL